MITLEKMYKINFLWKKNDAQISGLTDDVNNTH